MLQIDCVLNSKRIRKALSKYITSEKYTLWKAFILEGSMFAKSRISIPQKLPFLYLPKGKGLELFFGLIYSYTAPQSEITNLCAYNSW